MIRDRWNTLVLAALLAVLSGCMSFEIEGAGSKTTKSGHGTATIHGSFWGFMWVTPQVEQCEGKALFRVE